MQENDPALNDVLLNVDSTNKVKRSRTINYDGDVELQTLQQNLIMMGFDLLMINKVLTYFKIRQLNQAIDYLVKADDGLWNHPYINKIEEPEEKEEGRKSIIEEPKNVFGNMISKMKSIDSGTLTKKFSAANVCEICGESKDFHRIKNDFEENPMINEEENHNAEENDNLLNSNNEDNNKENILIEKKKIEINENECGICMGEFEDPIEIENCKDKFCKECFKEYLINLIKSNNIEKIPCPRVDCNNKNLSEEFFLKFLTEEQKEKYNKFKEQNEIANDNQKMFCPLCNSYAKIEEGTNEQYDVNSPTYKKTTLVCQKGHEFCSCGRPQHTGDCYKDGKEFDKLILKQDIKKCPKCGFLIKKNHGCNHMTCGNPMCKYQFCWLCLKEYTPDHYSVGDCSGLQFTNPKSFSYKFQKNCPCLYCLFNCLLVFFFIVLIVVGGTVFPAIGLWFMAFQLLFAASETKCRLFASLLVTFPILLALQNLGYIAVAIFIIRFALNCLCCILSCFCPCPRESDY